jgi:hypothetical protein
MRAPERRRLVVGESGGTFKVTQNRKERAVGMVGRALQTNFGMRLAGDAGKHRLTEARLAEARLTGQQKELALSGDDRGPAVQYERKFGITADEGGGGTVTGSAKAAGLIAGGKHLPGRDAGAEALQRKRFDRF